MVVKIATSTGVSIMANNDLRLQQRAKLLARRKASSETKPKVTLSAKDSANASFMSMNLISKSYNIELITSA